MLSQRRKLSAIRQDIPDQIMIVLHMRFLIGSLRITIEDIRSCFSGQRIGLKEGDFFKFRASVGEVREKSLKKSSARISSSKSREEAIDSEVFS